MLRFILSRLLQALISFLVVAVVVFALMRISGNPVDLLLPEESTAQTRAHEMIRLGLDKSYVEQLVRYLAGIIVGDFGRSVINNIPVIVLLRRAIINTTIVSVAAMTLALAVAIPAGVHASRHPDGILDRIAQVLAALGQSLPPFVTGIFLVLVFSVGLRWLPTSGSGGIRYMIMPSITLGWYLAAGVFQLTRASMLEVLRTDYIRLARAKGVPNRDIIWKHAFKNAALPVVTFSAMLFASLLGGSIVIEYVFAWPGLGVAIVDAVYKRDFPVVQGAVLLSTALFLAISLVVDIAYAYLNPRITFDAS
jgi:peptide/nickel transport system permease protein